VTRHNRGVDFSNGPTVSGKRFLPMISVGCLVFCVVLGFGTYFLAQWTTPFFEKMAKERPVKH